MKQLLSLAYLSAYELPPGCVGVETWDLRRAYAGVNLFVSGHEPAAFLIDFHTNGIQVLDGMHADASPHFRKGNFLVSLRELVAVAIVNPERESIVWVQWDGWDAQHDPCLLRNGNLLMFDNLGDNGKSRVIEFDPFSGETLWSFSGTAQRETFFLRCPLRGTCSDVL